LDKPLQKIFQFLYGPFFAVLDFFMRNYRVNRQRLGRLLARKGVSSFLQNAAIALLIIWILISCTAPILFRDWEMRTGKYGVPLKSFTKQEKPDSLASAM